MLRLLFFLLTIILILPLKLKSQGLQINEVVSKNYNGLESFENKTEDWIEIYNNSNDTLQLQNYFLSDDINILQAWQFPNIEIYPDNFVIIFASEKNIISPELHTNFKLKSEGEKLFLSNTNIVDSISIPSLKADISYGRLNELSNQWTILDIPSPKQSNTLSNHLTFSNESGFYQDEFELSVEAIRTNQTIHYTLDGSEPNINSNILSNNILIEDRSYLPNSISTIRTSPVENVYYHNWSIPKVNLKKGTNIRFASFENNKRTSLIYSKNYFVNLKNEQLKTIALSIDSQDLFNNENGIYVPGNHFKTYNVNGTGNYFLDKSVRANINIITSENESILNENCKIKIQGKATRASAQKSLKIYAKKSEATNYFNANIFNENSNTKFKRFVIRNTQGSTAKSFISDELAIEIVKNLNIDYSDYEFCDVFFNGEYWGIHSLREKFDEHYFNIKYDIDIDNIIIAEADLITPIFGDNVELKNLKHLLETSNLDDEPKYNYVKSILDINSFIDYMCAEMFLNNFDWPGNNSKLWKTNKPNSKWRFLFYDLDDTFREVNRNMFEHCTAENSDSWRNGPEHTLLFRKLLENNDFKTQFINRYQELLLTNFSTEKTLKALFKIIEITNPKIQDNIDRWNYPYSRPYWLNTIDDDISAFLIKRPCKVAKQLSDFFEIENKLQNCDDSNKKEPLIFSVFPNPSKGNINIIIHSNDLNQIINLLIFDTKGVQVSENILFRNEENTFQLNNLSLNDGIYFVRIISKNKYHGVQKLIIKN